MIAAPGGQLRTFAFGDLDTGTWATASLTASGGQATFGGGLTVEGSGATDAWRLAGDAVELQFAPIGEPAGIEVGDARGLVQLCRVEGRLRWEGAEAAVQCFGIRADGGFPEARFASARAALAWFGDEVGFALLAARPPRARGHEADSVGAVLFEAGAAVAVAEPRLSTTYDGDGHPSRAGLELWLSREDDDEDDDEQHPPRRAAGEADGAGASETATAAPAAPAFGGADSKSPLEVRSQPFRWQMQGRQGAGVYQLLRRR